MSDDNKPMTREDFGVQLTRIVEEAFAEIPDGEQFMFQVGVNMQVASPMVFIWLRSPVLGGEVLRGGFSIDNPFTFTPEEAEQGVSMVVRTMLDGRSKILAEQNGRANGHPLLGGQ